MLATLESRSLRANWVARFAALICLATLVLLGARPAKAEAVTFFGSVYQTNGSQSVPITGAQVLLFNGSSWIGPSVTDTYGRYAFYNTPPGTYLLRVIIKGKIVWNETVKAPSANHVVVLRI